MHIVITGGAGFVGVRLARALLARKALSLCGGPEQRIMALTLVDRMTPPDDLTSARQVHAVVGDSAASVRRAPARSAWRPMRASIPSCATTSVKVPKL